MVPDTSAILREAKKQGLELDVVDLGQQYYDPAFAEEPAADGAFVLTNTTPFTETDSTPALQVYDKWMEEVGGPKTSASACRRSPPACCSRPPPTRSATTSPARAWSTALEGIHEWDGGGLQLLADPGANKHNDCFLYLQIKDKDFVRAFPKKGFSCDPDNVVTLKKKYVTG